MNVPKSKTMDGRSSQVKLTHRLGSCYTLGVGGHNADAPPVEEQSRTRVPGRVGGTISAGVGERAMSHRAPGRTDFLYAQPRGIFGVARLFSFIAPFDRYNTTRTGREADARALRQDWRVVGDTIFGAILKYRRMSHLAHSYKGATGVRTARAS